jgi:hypothetical protein
MGNGETSEEVNMDVMNHQQAEREAQRIQVNREGLVERVARAIRQDGTAQPLPGLHLYRLGVLMYGQKPGLGRVMRLAFGP